MNFVLLSAQRRLLGILLIQQPAAGWPKAGAHSCELHTLDLTSPSPPDPMARFIRDHAGAPFDLSVSYVNTAMTALHATEDGWAFEAHAGGLREGWSITRGSVRHRGDGYFLRES